MPFQFEIHLVPEEIKHKELSVWEMRSIYDGNDYGNCTIYETSLAVGNPSVPIIVKILEIPLSTDDKFTQVDEQWLAEVNMRYRIFLETQERNLLTEKILNCINLHLTSGRTLIIYTGQ